MTTNKDMIESINNVLDLLIEETIRSPKGSGTFTTQDLLIYKMKLLEEENK